MEEFYKNLKMESIKINWNKRPIKMKLFLSFLLVKTEKRTNFLGCDTGWTKYTGDNGLEITGGVVGGVEYLDHILYGKNLDNQYNNYVNPFYLFDIMSEDGQKFFIDYYSAEIKFLLSQAGNKCEHTKKQYHQAVAKKEALFEFWGKHGVPTSGV